MKKALFIFALSLGIIGSTWAGFDFSAVAPSGQTLYYYIISNTNNVCVTHPGPGGNDISYYWYGYTKPTGTITIPSSVTFNGKNYYVVSIEYAFSGCTELTSVNIPNSVTSIIGAFSGCTSLKTVSIPSTVTDFQYAFQGCTSLISFSIPENINFIDEGAFQGCTSLTTLNIPKHITKIHRNAFYGCIGLRSLNIPNHIDSIGPGAFGECTGLTSVTIPNSIKSIKFVFNGCTGLTTVSIPNSISNIDFAFQGCSGLTTISIPNSVSSFKGAFENCIGLTSVIFSDSITFIDQEAFRGSGLKTFNIPVHIDSIGPLAFAECTELTSVTIPNSVTAICHNAFRGCTKLLSVTIPNSVVSIWSNAFLNCTGLTAISFEGRTPPVIGKDAFYGVPTNVPVYIPCGTLALYAARLPYLTNFIENTFTFSAVSADDQMGLVQVLNQPTCTNPNAVLNAIPNDGYKFDHWSTGSKMNPYNLTVNTDTVITAYFVSKEDGIGEASKDGIRVYAHGNRIVVEGAEGKTIRVFDTMGQLVGNHALPAGIYYVKIGNYATRKVAVFK